jgi:uncharacterized protein with PIN domain
VIYLDTSCLLKLLREELESAEVRQAVDAEEVVVVSSLTELETKVPERWKLRTGASMRNLRPCGRAVS